MAPFPEIGRGAYRPTPSRTNQQPTHRRPTRSEMNPSMGAASSQTRLATGLAETHEGSARASPFASTTILLWSAGLHARCGVHRTTDVKEAGTDLASIASERLQPRRAMWRTQWPVQGTPGAARQRRTMTRSWRHTHAAGDVARSTAGRQPTRDERTSRRYLSGHGPGDVRWRKVEFAPPLPSRCPIQ